MGESGQKCHLLASKFGSLPRKIGSLIPAQERRTGTQSGSFSEQVEKLGIGLRRHEILIEDLEKRGEPRETHPRIRKAPGEALRTVGIG